LVHGGRATWKGVAEDLRWCGFGWCVVVWKGVVARGVGCGVW